MWTNGQRVEVDEVEPALREAYPSIPHFKANVSEIPEIEKGRIRIITTLTGPNGEPIVANGRTATYYALKDAVDALPQIEGYAA